MFYLDKDPSVQKIINATFPEYKGRRIQCDITDTFSLYGTNWSGGTRNRYAIVRLSDMKSILIEEAHWLNPDHMYMEMQTIPPDFAVVRYTEGAYESITIITPSSNILQNKLENHDLTIQERIVLVATRVLKNSYGGQTDLRFKEAHYYTGISREEWNKAKENLILNKYLTKAGSLTNKGRNNAIGQLYDQSLKLNQV